MTEPQEPPTGEEGEPTVQTAVPWRALEAFPLWIVAFLLTSFVGVGICLGERNPKACLNLPRNMVALTVANEALLLFCTLAWIRIRHQARAAALGFRAVTTDVIRAAVRTAFVGLAVAYGFLIVALGIANVVLRHAPDLPPQFDVATRPSVAVLAVGAFGIVVLAPIAEEVFFRGFLYRSLRSWMRPSAAIVASAAAFGLAHFNWLRSPATFLLGIVLARSLEERNNLWPAILAHMVFNAFGFALLLLTS